MEQQLADACPEGIDVYFENVGGRVLQAVIPLLNQGARIPVCGLIAAYNATALPDGPDRTGLLMRAMLIRQISMRGFIVFNDLNQMFKPFMKDMSTWLAEGKIHYQEDMVDGLENAPEAFMGLLEGKNFGKLVVKVAEA